MERHVTILGNGNSKTDSKSVFILLPILRDKKEVTKGTEEKSGINILTKVNSKLSINVNH